MAPWDSALQALIEALDERRDARGSRCLRNRRGRHGPRSLPDGLHRLPRLLLNRVFDLLQVVRFEGRLGLRCIRRPRECVDLCGFRIRIDGPLLSQHRLDLRSLREGDSMVWPDVEGLSETAQGLGQFLHRREDDPAFHPGVRVLRTDSGRALQDRRGGREFIEESEDTAQAKPRLLVFRTQFKGAKVGDGGLVRAVDPEIRFPEQDPRRTVLVIARDRLQERLDGLLEASLSEERDRQVHLDREFLLPLGARPLVGLGADVGLEAMALLVRLRPDPVEGRPDHVGVVLNLRFRGIRHRDFRVLIGRRRRSGKPRPPPFPSDERAVDRPSHHLLEDDVRPFRPGPRLRPETSTARVAVRRVGLVEGITVRAGDERRHGPSYTLITDVTWNRPSSKTSAENPVRWCAPRIFDTRIRRWTSTSVIWCILSSRIPSARNVSSRRGWGASSPRNGASLAASASTRVVAPRSRSHSKNWNSSVQRSENLARTSRASRESTTMRSTPSMSFFVVSVLRRNSIHGLVALLPISFWIVPTSRMWTSPRTSSTSKPIAAIWSSRLFRVCSRDT